MTEPSALAESSSLYVELGLTDSETNSDEEVSPEINAVAQEEGQAGPNPDEQDEGQAGSNPGDAAVDQPQSKLATSTGTLSSLQNLDTEISFTNQFLEERSREDEPDKTNTEAEVQSMVMVPIHHDTSLVPLMTSPVIDLTVLVIDILEKLVKSRQTLSKAMVGRNGFSQVIVSPYGRLA
ncbi:hypothetical protein Tco_1322176 [Tanacetum coccineum]